MENATTRYLMSLKVRATNAKNVSVNLRELLPFLQEENIRWHEIKPDMMNCAKSSTLKVL